MLETRIGRSFELLSGSLSVLRLHQKTLEARKGELAYVFNSLNKQVISHGHKYSSV